MSPVERINIEYYQTTTGRCPYLEWFDRVREGGTRDRIDVRLARLRLGNLSDHRDLGQGLRELRLFIGPGYRIYFTRRGDRVVILSGWRNQSHTTAGYRESARIFARSSGKRAMSRNETHPPTRSYKQHLVERLQAREDHGAGYLDAALEEGASTFLLALKDVIDAFGGETMLARKTGLHRVSLHKIASGRGNPTLSSLVAVMEGLDLRLAVARKRTAAAGTIQARQPALKAR